MSRENNLCNDRRHKSLRLFEYLIILQFMICRVMLKRQSNMKLIHIFWACLLSCVWSSSKSYTQVILKKNPIQMVFRPFEFAYQSNDGLGTTQHRKESGNENGSVKGSYGFTDHHGMYRAVDYVADNNGFRAVVKTNEPGTANQNPADTVWLVQPPPDTIPPPPGSRLLLQNIYLPVQASPANYTPEESSSVVSNTLFPSLRFQPRLQYPYSALTYTQEAVQTVQGQTINNRNPSPKVLAGARIFMPRMGISKK